MPVGLVDTRFGDTMLPRGVGSEGSRTVVSVCTAMKAAVGEAVTKPATLEIRGTGAIFARL